MQPSLNYDDSDEKFILLGRVFEFIENEKTKRMITKLIARPGQITRYYEQGKAPKELIKLAREHEAMSYNYI